MQLFGRMALCSCLLGLLPGTQPLATSHGAPGVSPKPLLDIQKPDPQGTIRLRATPIPDHYLVLEQSTNYTDYVPVEVRLAPATVALTFVRPFQSCLPQTGFRLRAQLLDQPGDIDRDGIDDVFELLRPQALDPFNPLDADQDADGDGISNLLEYQEGTEPAPVPADAIRYFPTLLHLQAHTPAPIPPLVYLAGHDQPEDGWGGWFTFDSHDTGPADGAIRIAWQPDRPGRLQRLLQPDTEISSGWWRPSQDGSSNAAPQLQQALDFLATRTLQRLRILPGRYRIDARPTMYDPGSAVLRAEGLADFTIDGSGATLFSPEDGDILMIRNCSRGIIRSLDIEGPGSDRGLEHVNYAAIQLAGIGSDLLFEHCRIRGFMHGISHLHGPKTTTRVTIRQCRFEDGGDTRHVILEMDGAAISGIGDDWTIEDNDIHECARGIEVENTGKTHPIHRVIIRNNRLTHVRGIGIMSFMGAIDPPIVQQSDIQLIGNVLQGKPGRHRRPDGTAIPIMLVSLSGGHRLRVSGNLCQDADYAGISLYAAQADIDHAIVSENVIYQMNGRGIQILGSPSFSLSNVSVLNNRIEKCRDRGLLLRGNNLVVQGNAIQDCAIAGIDLSNSREPLLSNNVIRLLLPDTPAIHVWADTLDAQILDNYIVDAPIGIRNASTSTTLARNTFLRVTTEMQLP